MDKAWKLKVISSPLFLISWICLKLRGISALFKASSNDIGLFSNAGISDKSENCTIGSSEINGSLSSGHPFVVIDIVSKEGKTITSIPLNEITVCSQINGESSISPWISNRSVI